MKKRNIMKIVIILIALLILGITVAYAIMSQTLNVKGQAEIIASTWEVYFANPVVDSNSVTKDVPIITNKTTVSFSTTLSNPGDYYDFDIEIVNDGTIDAMIESIEKTPELTSEQAKYLDYKMTYYAGKKIEKGHLIEKGTKKKISVRVEYKKDVVADDLPKQSEILNLSFKLKYIQNDGTGVAVDDSACVTPETLVLMSDGTQKRIDELSKTDKVAVWDFYEGKLSSSTISIYHSYDETIMDILELRFDDGSHVRVIKEHDFYDFATNKFVNITPNTVENYIGHQFAKYENKKIKKLKLVDYKIYQELTTPYWIQTSIHNNAVTNNILSQVSTIYEGWLDYFKINDDMKYDAEDMKKQINKYGLSPYEDWSDFASYQTYIDFNGKYLDILIGRGTVTKEQVYGLFMDILGGINN